LRFSKVSGPLIEIKCIDKLDACAPVQGCIPNWEELLTRS